MRGLAAPLRARLSQLAHAALLAALLTLMLPILPRAARSDTTPSPATVTATASNSPAPPTVRVEAHSAKLTAVGSVRGDTMTIYVSRNLDNSPVRDAVVDVQLRGILHPTVAQPDGGYMLHSPGLKVPGSAAVVFRVAMDGATSNLDATLRIAQPGAGAGDDVADDKKPEDKNSTRQLGWWVLNFAVCIGFLMLLSRRRKNAPKE